ncbi:ABC transporter ATP-binding protein [Streptomyces violaceorubidus]
MSKQRAPMVVVEELHKEFRGTPALRGVSLDIGTGEIMALLGPNGAGKTTVVRVLTTLLRPDSGRARVDGWDVRRDPAQVRRSTGVAGQYSSVDDMLTGFENLYLVARLRGMKRAPARRTAGDLLDRFRLAEVAGRPAAGYSGGMRRRLDLAAALIGEPSLVVLDEPTTGLDPEARLDTWEEVGRLAARGTTILLTTQYLEEADRLADRITVIDRGRVVAAGTSDRLKAAAGTSRLFVVVARDDEMAAAVRAARLAGGAEPTVDPRGRRVEVAAGDGQEALARVLTALRAEGVQALEIGLGRATLDDVFLGLTTRTRGVTR